MKEFFGKLGVVVVILGILYAVYAFALPEYPKSYVTSIVQPKVNATADSMITKVKQATNKDIPGKTYEQIFTSKKNSTNAGCWIYVTPEDSSDGAEHVIFYAKGATINLKGFEDYNGGLLYTSAVIKMDFKISGGSFDLIPYVDDLNTPLVIYDGKHTKDNAKVKKAILEQLDTGMKEEN